MPRYIKPPMERFMEKVQKSPDGCWLWTASLSDGYGQFQTGRGPVKSYRWIYEQQVGPVPSGHDLDHSCRVRSCVNPDHLRVVTRKQNQENHAAWRPEHGHRGVCFHKASGKWMARVKHAGVDHYLGLFVTEQEAADAARARRNELYTHNEEDRA